MSISLLVSNLKKVGWKDFTPGNFLKVDFDTIGKAKIAKNNWFVLIKSVPRKLFRLQLLKEPLRLNSKTTRKILIAFPITNC